MPMTLAPNVIAATAIARFKECICPVACLPLLLHAAACRTSCE
jgi:hypothetical protein